MHTDKVASQEMRTATAARSAGLLDKTLFDTTPRQGQDEAKLSQAKLGRAKPSPSSLDRTKPGGPSGVQKLPKLAAAKRPFSMGEVGWPKCLLRPGRGESTFRTHSEKQTLCEQNLICLFHAWLRSWPSSGNPCQGNDKTMKDMTTKRP